MPMTEPTTLVRQATVKDAGAIAKIHVDTWRSAYRGLVSEDYLAALSYRRAEDRWITQLSGAAGFCLVAETSGGVMVGFAAGGPERENSPEFASEVYALYVTPSYHRRGVGRQLMVAMAREFLRREGLGMKVWVLAGNPARGFYEALGGRLAGQKPIEIGGKPLLEVAYGWPDVRLLAGESRV